MNKKIILFDIDGTLINTKVMAKVFCERIAKESNINLEEIIEFRDEYISNLEHSTDYHPNDLINFINKKTNKKLDSEDIFFKEKDIYKKYIFYDAINLLDKLKKSNYEIGIFSEGFDDYQIKKISGIIDFFDKDFIFITRRKLSDNTVKKLPNGAIIVDDKREVIETLKKLRPDLELVWINRKDEEKIDGVRTIKSLEMLLLYDDK